MTGDNSANFTPAERIESVKAGFVAGICLLATFGAIALTNTILSQRFESLVNLSLGAFKWELLLRGAIAFISGFLFGVTYRYIIRQDSNPQLKAGGIMAFGLVRALGQIDGGLSLTPGKMPATSDIWPFAVAGIESIVLFVVTGVVLDWAIAKGWLKPFLSA